MTDVILVSDGIVTQVWRDTAIETIPTDGLVGSLHVTPPEAAVCGMGYVGGQLVVPMPRVSESDVVRERTRRLALGFSYNFGDARGVHRIGMTAADMAGWDEVSVAAQAAINLGAPNAPLNIVTDTGPVSVTAQEWQSILMAAAQARQPIWAASFALQAMQPIPSDFADDSWWY